MNHEDNYPVRGAILFGMGVIAVFLATFGLWASFASLSGAVMAPGRLSLSAHRQPVAHPAGGRIARVFAREGDHVRSGDILLALDSSEQVAERTAVEGRLARLLVEEARLSAERDGSSTIGFPPDIDGFAVTQSVTSALRAEATQLLTMHRAARAAEAESLNRRAVDADREAESIAGEIAALDAQTDLVRRDLEIARTLHSRGLAAREDVSRLERERARLAGQRADADARAAQARGAAAAAAAERVGRDLSRQTDTLDALRQTGAEIAALSDRRRALTLRIAALELRAPSDGTVMGLGALSPSAVLPAGAPALFVVAGDAPLVVEAHIRPEDIDDVHQGQAARLRLAALDPHTTAELPGRVTLVSPDVMTDSPNQRPFYRAEVAIDSASLAALDPHALIAGMPVEVFLTTGEGTPLSYLAGPLFAYFGRAMHEG